MPRKSLKNRKLSPWLTEGVEHWRWLEDRLHPLPEVTSPEYSGAWMDEVWTRSIGEAFERARLRLASQSPQKTALTPAPAPVKPKPGKV